ncbi:hypothetical protein A2625_04850 [candidate division WOR-1 bacterium RIFCSPHIGHO2_01_FULL_53_15]|uniref:Uncharacterized protein n=1 Tax=candidate division WOR-1 bacterium RIFCSPHIGHO2_01_FULL_53_15 TaxID=1802564 RepID=A0A1F4Q2G3_UNCSA|nr:MAG: hypothetical protein A2625_04850 [candidate division WOR-1 bacterium RIFCSPHIGHO2_01_FULL_53_15]OGC13208.1 MAG: hypothetical protein A3D23_01105 [candidate division WOR-1 bacterium RIFCSPHIGHO2_02_FULL_53_26]
MNKHFSKKMVMSHYYSDEELKDMLKMPINRMLKWLESARRFVNKITPKETKKLQEKLLTEGW